jgi:hypothetical protein
MVFLFRVFLISLCATALLACGDDESDVQQLARSASQGATLPAEYEAAPEVFALGPNVAPGGKVARDANEGIYGRGTRIFLSVDTRSASVPQDIAVEWRRGENVVRRQKKRAALESRSVLFDSGATRSWPPGRHEAIVFIDGRKVATKDFVLR